jgi:hypothetical protein
MIFIANDQESTGNHDVYLSNDRVPMPDNGDGVLPSSPELLHNDSLSMPIPAQPKQLRKQVQGPVLQMKQLR